MVLYPSNPLEKLARDYDLSVSTSPSSVTPYLPCPAHLPPLCALCSVLPALSSLRAGQTQIGLCLAGYIRLCLCLCSVKSASFRAEPEPDPLLPQSWTGADRALSGYIRLCLCLCSVQSASLRAEPEPGSLLPQSWTGALATSGSLSVQCAVCLLQS